MCLGALLCALLGIMGCRAGVSLREESPYRANNVLHPRGMDAKGTKTTDEDVRSCEGL